MTRASHPGLELEIADGLATLTLDNAEQLNAIGVATFEALVTSLDEIVKPKHGVRALLLRGAGRAFCSGLNLREDRSALQPASGLGDALLNPLMRRLRALQVPVVASVQGPCVGVGVAMALTADFIVAAQNAYFLLPYRNLGVSIDGGTTWILPRIVGWARARRMLMLAERVSAETALQWGMVHAVVPTDALEGETAKLCDDLANGPTVALGIMRQDFWKGWESGYDEHLEFELATNHRAMRSKDAGIARRTVLSNETPRFTGE